MGLLRRTLYDAPTKVKLIAYKTLCRQKLEYAAEVWDPFQRNHVYMIEMVQNKAIRFILNLKGRCSISEARENLGLPTLESRRMHQRIKMLHYIIEQSDQLSSFSELKSIINLWFSSTNNTHETRSQSQGQPIAIFTNTNIFYHSFVPRTRTTRNLGVGPSFANQ